MDFRKSITWKSSFQESFERLKTQAVVDTIFSLVKLWSITFLFLSSRLLLERFCDPLPQRSRHFTLTRIPSPAAADLIHRETLSRIRKPRSRRPSSRSLPTKGCVCGKGRRRRGNRPLRSTEIVEINLEVAADELLVRRAAGSPYHLVYWA